MDLTNNFSCHNVSASFFCRLGKCNLLSSGKMHSTELITFAVLQYKIKSCLHIKYEEGHKVPKFNRS